MSGFRNLPPLIIYHFVFSTNALTVEQVCLFCIIDELYSAYAARECRPAICSGHGVVSIVSCAIGLQGSVSIEMARRLKS